MSRKKKDREDRMEQHYRRLGTRNPICRACAEQDPRCMELHHVAGKDYHDDTEITCRNCHRKLSDEQLDHAPTVPGEPTGTLAVIGHYLLGVSDFLALIVETLRRFGQWLLDASVTGEIA
jgi:hypothetical protein